VTKGGGKIFSFPLRTCKKGEKADRLLNSSSPQRKKKKKIKWSLSPPKGKEKGGGRGGKVRYTFPSCRSKKTFLSTREGEKIRGASGPPFGFGGLKTYSYEPSGKKEKGEGVVLGAVNMGGGEVYAATGKGREKSSFLCGETRGGGENGPGVLQPTPTVLEGEKEKWTTFPHAHIVQIPAIWSKEKKRGKRPFCFLPLE